MTTPFGFADWVVVVGFLVLSLAIGLVAMRRVSSLDDFLLTGRRLRSFWGVATLASTELGLVTVVYFSEEAYKNGFVALAVGVIAGATMWFIGQTGFVIKSLRALELRTVPEYFQRRFTPGVRWLAGVLTFLTGILNMGIFLQVEGRFLAIVMGLPPESLPIIMGVLLVIVVIYTMLGGMFSVVLTDVFQFVLIAIGVILTSYYAFNYAGGRSGMVAAVREQFGEAGFNFLEAPKYGVLFLIWTTLYYISGWASWQPVAQRTLSMRNVAVAQRLFRISSLFMFFRACIPMLWGIAALAVLGMIDDKQTALPEMLIRVLPGGLIGLAVIGFLAASMSTYDSYLLAFSAIFVQDVWTPMKRRQVSEKQRLLYTRVAIPVIAIFVYAWGVSFTFTDTALRVIMLTGSLSYAGIMAGLVGGIYWRRANTAGMYCAFALSALPPLVALAVPRISSTNAGLLSFVLAPLGLIVGSLYFRSDRLRGPRHDRQSVKV